MMIFHTEMTGRLNRLFDLGRNEFKAPIMAEFTVLSKLLYFIYLELGIVGIRFSDLYEIMLENMVDSGVVDVLVRQKYAYFSEIDGHKVLVPYPALLLAYGVPNKLAKQKKHDAIIINFKADVCFGEKIVKGNVTYLFKVFNLEEATKIAKVFSKKYKLPIMIKYDGPQEYAHYFEIVD